ARVGLSFLHAGRDRAPAQQLGLGLVTADADRKLGWADTAARLGGEELLHRPVLKRVEGDRGEATAEREHLPGFGQRLLERLEPAVDRDPDRLEAALGGMAAAEAGRGWHPSLDRGDQFGGCPQGAPTDDLAGDSAGVALLAEAAQDLGDPRL